VSGKQSTSTSGVSIPPAVLAQYQSVNAAANQTAQTPFQQYNGEFVAPVNDEQYAGVAGTNSAATEAQPFYSAATAGLGAAQAGTAPYNAEAAGTLGASQAGTQPYNAMAANTLSGAQGATAPVNAAAEAGTAASAAPLSGSQIEQYLSPYLSTVLGSEAGVLNQNNQQQQAGQLGDAITSGAFGGDRTGIAAANLEEQQNLANSNIYSNILNTGYQSALSTAQGQQQIGLAGAQQLASIGQTAYGEGANTASEAAALGQTAYGEGANTASEAAALGQTAYGEGANTASGLAALGTGAQTAGLQGAQAQIGAGTVEQQTQQAEDTAQYNQFLQQQSYPFQVDQFLANIAEGTGALSGSTTTTTQPGGFFSDRRLKRDIKKIGETFDHQDVVTYKMGDDDRTRIGLIAQDVEKKHPDAVGLAAGFKVVDYGKATKDAAKRGKFAEGGLAGAGAPIIDPATLRASDEDMGAHIKATHPMGARMTGGGTRVHLNDGSTWEQRGGRRGDWHRGHFDRGGYATGGLSPGRSSPAGSIAAQAGLGAPSSPSGSIAAQAGLGATSSPLPGSITAQLAPTTGSAPASAPSSVPSPVPIPAGAIPSSTHVPETPGPAYTTPPAYAMPGATPAFASPGSTFATTPGFWSPDLSGGFAHGGDVRHRDAANNDHFYEGGVVPFRRARAVGGTDDGLAGALQAQQAMYSGMPGGGAQRQINQSGTGGGSHSLPVSNAPAVAPQSGISQVNSGINTVNNGYKLYGNMTKSAATPSGGVVPAQAVAQPTGLQAAGLQPSGAITAGAPADSATEGALATAAPMDTAVDAGATAAGEGAAADAAGTAATSAAAGAAGTAAAGAATDAAATAAAEAAAALAAEYAVADVGASAILLAKRGGAIRRKYDAGGTPYLESSLDSSGNLNIPEDPNTSTLKAAPGAGKLPTGLQTMMKMGNPTDWSDMAGSMFSNQALATGGVAGRRGYDDGGTPTADDTVQVPDQTVGVAASDASASAPSDGGVAGGAVPAASAEDTQSGLGAIWNKVKGSALAKPENWVPLLSAISAMGTAKTVHPGVALAAGLGAGAQAYQGEQTALAQQQRTQAETGLIGARATGAGLQNQMTQLGINDIRNPPPTSLPDPVRPTGMTPSDPTDPQELAFQKFAPLPTARPDYVTNRINAYNMANKPEVAKSIGDQYDQQIAGANQTRTLGASSAYLSFANAANAPSGQALSMVAKLNPQKAAQIQQSGADPATQDQQARDWAGAMGLQAHSWSGRPTTMQNGVLIDQPTSSPVVGSNQLLTGLTPEDKQAAYTEAMQPITLDNGLPGRNYQKFGMTAPEQYIMAKDKAARMIGGTPSGGMVPAQGGAPPTTTLRAVPSPAAGPAAAPAARKLPRAAPAAVPAAATVSAQTPAVDQPTADPYLSKALADPKFNLQPLPKVVDQTTRQAALTQQGINQNSAAKLKNDAAGITDSASMALQYLTSARSIMNSKGATVGMYGGLLTQASRVLGGGPQSTNYQELAKYLGNAGVQAGRGNFPNATQQEMGLQLTELSPHEKMNADTINDLLATNIRATKYTLASADRAPQYVAAGKDPQAFQQWNQAHYPREKVVNASQTASGPGGQKMYEINGKWVQ
jgi:hypothetical protein